MFCPSEREMCDVDLTWRLGKDPVLNPKLDLVIPNLMVGLVKDLVESLETQAPKACLVEALKMCLRPRGGIRE